MTAKPIAGEEILDDHHREANHHSIGDAQIVVAGKSVAAEDGAADDGLEQIVGEAHATEDAEMVEHSAHTFEGIPGGDDG